MTEDERKNLIRALERELKGYELRGLKDRCVLVAKQIAALQGDTPIARAERRPRRRGEQRA